MSATAAVVHDVVILHGRVMDPASGVDASRNIGISDGQIRAVTNSPLQGRDTIDARGLVVAPGFIDLHQHAQTPPGYCVEAIDGTTTALELEAGTADVDAWYDERAGRALINYGVSVSHEFLRMRVMGDTSQREASGAAKSRAATARNATVHVHLRSLPEPYYYLETEEVIGAAAATGAAAHIVHIQSTGGEDTPRMLDLIRGARARGLDITTEVYPYTASMSPIESAEHDGWESYPDAKFARYAWPATGERLTRESFARYRKLGGNLIDYNNTEATVKDAVADPLPMFASDGILADSIGHLRVAGTFSRVLGRYARDTRALTPMDALRKITIEPARRMERRVPSMSRKGRIQAGADADLVIFDPARIIDRATYREPTLPPDGIPHVLVLGVAVVRDGRLQEGVFPGRAVRAPFR